ncbi:hypothetical protein [Vibrio phage vB_pir03]|nr:hypothetical protein [Vibrio phage vB_pir03]
MRKITTRSRALLYLSLSLDKVNGPLFIFI